MLCAIFEICSLNDLVVVGDDKFYFTNYKLYCLFMEMMFRVPFGSIGYYNGSSAKLMEDYLLFPNGIEVSKDKK